MNDTVEEKHDFGAEVGRLLDLVVHSLYSEREIFLRELVANAADAMDRRRFESLTDSALAPPAEAKVRIVPDKQARTLLIADDGIGMRRQELIDNLGTIARSGTRAFGADARVRQARGAAQPDRPVRRRLLLGLHGGRPGRGHLAQGGLRGGIHLGLGRGRAVHHRPGDARDSRHRCRAAHQVRRRGVPRSDAARGDRAQMGRPRHAADHHRPRRQGPAGQRGHRAVAQAAGGGLRAVVQRVLPPSRH